MPFTILVTGGAGYVGSHTILELLNAGFDVICIDNFANAHRDGMNVPTAISRVEQLTQRKVTFYSVNLLDKEAVKGLFAKHKIDCVAHFAALKSVGESCRLPLKYYQNNIIGSTILLEVMAEAGCYNFLYSSSATVYGETQYLPIDEKHPTGNCTNPYGKSKYFVEEILKDLCAADKKWKIISLRYFNPVGSHQSGQIGEDPNGIPNNLMPFIAQVAVGRQPSLKIFGSDYNTHDGTGVRDYIHVVDLAKGHLNALNKLEKDKQTGFFAYNLGTGCGYSVLDMVKAFEKASGRTVKYEIVARRPGDVAACYSDASLAERELGWKAKLGVKEMCEDTWRWQKNNPNGYAKL